MLTAVLSGFVVAALFVPFGKYFKGKWAPAVALLPLALFGYFLRFLPEISAGNTFRSDTPWVPSLGINLNFYLDGLSLLFALLITGIGTLVFLYAVPYLKGHRYLDRFFGYLTLFMTAMLGMVLADNILLFFIFWELTSISSFFLIGFNNESAASRKSALVALGITGGGGFMLMAGLVLMGYLSGTYSIQEMIASNALIKEHALYGWILLFVFSGAFTKSAQFPFHFWLPGAMKAPTPVSAYLHSATMVKAGVFLLARLFPVLGGTDFWTWPLVGIGGLTMLYAAIHALFRTDLKAVLAYTTVSALGMLVFLIGIGTKESLIAASVFILVHALYKATLFLVTGIVDLKTGTRDITRLGGLRRVMFPVALAALFAALSSAGLPLTYGFIGKDLIYEATLGQPGQLAMILTGLALVTNTLLLVGGFLAGIRPFSGKSPTSVAHIPKTQPMLWFAPLLLGTLGLILGCFPFLANGLSQATAAAISHTSVKMELKIWHGFNGVLLLSAVTLVAGTILYFMTNPSTKSQERLAHLEKWSTRHLISQIHQFLLTISHRYTGFWHNGYLRSYLFKILTFSAGLMLIKLFSIGLFPLDMSNISPVTIYEIVVSIIMLIAIYLTITTSSRLTAVVGTSVVGYCICLFFVFYSAPDLALTQFTIDTLTVVLFVLVLFRLPSFLKFANNHIKIRDAILSIVFGLGVAFTALHVLNEPVNNEVSSFFGDNAYRLAKGKNVVNVILVDFRGLDTMFEIVVLSIAAIGVYSLLKLRLKPTDKE